MVTQKEVGSEHSGNMTWDIEQINKQANAARTTRNWACHIWMCKKLTKIDMTRNFLNCPNIYKGKDLNTK